MRYQDIINETSYFDNINVIEISRYRYDYDIYMIQV